MSDYPQQGFDYPCSQALLDHSDHPYTKREFQSTKSTENRSRSSSIGSNSPMPRRSRSRNGHRHRNRSRSRSPASSADFHPKHSVADSNDSPSFARSKKTRKDTPAPKNGMLQQATNTAHNTLKTAVKYILELLVLTILVGGYTYFGGWLFNTLEGPSELGAFSQRNASRMQVRVTLYSNLKSVFNATNSCGSECDAELERLIKDFDAGEEVKRSDYNKFSFQGAMFYSMTLYTTIGYGTFAPSTDEGRIATMVYGLFGIALVMVMLGRLGVLIDKALNSLVMAVKRVTSCCKVSEASIIPPLCMLLVFSGYVALMIYYVQKTNPTLGKFHAAYFTFVSLTTIGLGDVMPSDDFDIAAAVLLLFGLAMIASIIATLSSFIHKLYAGNMQKLEQGAKRLKLMASADLSLREEP